MYKIEKRPPGFLLTFGGLITRDEMQKWYDESVEILKTAPSEFGIIIDMQDLKPLQRDVQSIMVEGQQAYRMKGMKRSCVILASAIIKSQFIRLAITSGIYSFERYIDASTTSNWMEQAFAWVKDGIGPDR